MGKNFLIDALRTANPKSSMFTGDASVLSYKTGFPILDYYLGYLVNGGPTQCRSPASRPHAGRDEET